jgi:hypothetical protein
MPGLLTPYPQMPTPDFTVNGTDLYRQAPYVDPSRPVYRPVTNRSGLLDDTKTNTLIQNFAGGLLNGYQYNPNAGPGQAQIAPTTPSGVYTADPDQAAPPAETGGMPQMTFGDAFGLAFAPYMNRDPMEAGGSEQAMRWYSQLAANNPSYVANRFGGLDLSQQYDPKNEQFQALMRDISQQGGVRGGGGDGGR